MTGDEDSPTHDRPRADGFRIDDDRSPVIRAVFDGLESGRALDVATGTGRNALALAARGWTVDAVDLSRAQLERGRERAAGRSLPGTVDWILADVDSYGFPTGTYDLIAVSFFDARDRLPSVIDALAPGGVLCYEHYLESPPGASGPGDAFRFEPNELLTACSNAGLTILYYAEHEVGGEQRVTLVARDESDDAGGDSDGTGGDEEVRWRPSLPPS